MSLVGKKVKVTFTNWPVSSATYVYEGHDEKGYWLRRKDGVQRHFSYEYVVSVEPAEDDIEEAKF
jgi:hypothetical protein